ncbi:RnfABCDGE type electron transport complex subunit G [Dictyoglomus thermophilum]|uniref:Ion-translocating oxidoreductase complex subunit G n=2 Tax=Dictyoglomus thermophilum TaxID=14 RepID=B5YE57_DICT6|nr:RnfABCDGE type electron transport complex subunit G [Dictyoglomus thermophilum]ACI18870.1 na+-transporting NADH:ubiquinone oxidoreductase, subunit 3 [Dictyoglomus thermophilum H-6-12]MCX7720963.1 RnfABCDGE type electron transport complex subunit G [Dictyoglomus thermophilum]TYT22427.1 RnfABCDGE type electron transport complex subunit G [Dictyoglomus thermophilum]
MKNILRYGLTLFIICAIAGGVLAYTYETTQKVIEANKIREKIMLLKELIPDASDFVSSSNKPNSFDPLVTIKEIYIAKKDGKDVGRVWEVSTKGYSSDIVLLVAINDSGAIEKVKVVSQQETPGLGTEVTKDDFLAQFIGKKEANLEVKKNVKPVSGATISSSAVVRAINEVLKHNKI